MRLLLLVFMALSLTTGDAYTQKENYSDLVEIMHSKRIEFQNAYIHADREERAIIVKRARTYLMKTFSEEIFQQWYGTKWDYNGMSRTPGEGSIACGYFVTTTLADIGFDIPRIKWAQAASEVFIKELAPDNLKRFSQQPLSEVESYLKESGDGLYLVGLDSHVGYILVNGNNIQFIHSNYYQADIGVMSEDIQTENALAHSSYRVIGKLLSDEMVVKWINHISYQ